MIRYTEILQTAHARRFRHGLKRFGAVGSDRMTVKYAANVVITNEVWQRTFACHCNLVAPFPEFGLDIVEVQSRIDLRLGCSRDQRFVAIKAVRPQFESSGLGKLLQ